MAGPTQNENAWKPKTWKNVVSIDVRYKDRFRSHPEVCIWRRTKSGKTMVVDRDLFPSYFYIPRENMPELQNIQGGILPDSYELPTARSLDRKELIKVVYGRLTKNEFKLARDSFTKTYEDDIKYNWRYLLDNNIEFAAERRICFFDIETDMSVDVKNTPAPILSIAVYDNFSNKAGILLLDTKAPAVTITETNGGHFLIIYPTEKELLTAFLNYIHAHDPDILTAYNLVGFDFPYLVNRMKKIGVDYRELSSIGSVYAILAEEDRQSNKIHCAGRELMDYYLFIKKLYDEDKPEDYRLDTVGKHICGISKIDYKSLYSSLRELYEKNIDMFIEYNIQDVLIMKALEEKVGFIQKYYVSLQKLIPMPLAELKDNSIALDFYILKSYNGKIVFPSKRNREKQTFKAAITGRLVELDTGEIVSTDPFKKKYANIGVLDFSAMYPNILRTFNISPETITDIPDDDSIEIEGVRFEQEPIGLIPQLVEGLITLRKTYQDKLEELPPSHPEYPIYYNLQYGVKRLNNSFFGATGYSGFRLFDVRVAQSITAFGRDLIKKVFVFLRDVLKRDSIYGDTDSVFIQLLSDPNDKEATEKEIAWIEDEINKMLVKLVDSMGSHKNYMKMDFEKRFSSLIFMGVKKRYIGFADLWKGKWLEDPKFVVKGFDLVRRDMPNAVKGTIEKIIRMFLHNEDTDKIKEYYVSEMKRIRSLGLQELAWSKGLNKGLHEYKNNAQHVGACVASNILFGLEFEQGDYPKLMYLNPGIRYILGNTEKIADVIAFKTDSILPEYVYKRIDYDRYISSFIEKKLEVFSGVEGMEMEKILMKQTSLFSFMGTNVREELLNG